MTLRDVTNSSTENICIYCQSVTGRGFCSTARTYGPYVRVSKMHPYIRPVYTARIYGRSVHTTRIYFPYSRKALRTMFLYGPYVRAAYTGDQYALPVNTGRKYGCQNTPVCTGRTYGPYIRAVFTGSAYRPLGIHHTYNSLTMCVNFAEMHRRINDVAWVATVA